MSEVCSPWFSHWWSSIYFCALSLFFSFLRLHSNGGRNGAPPRFSPFLDVAARRWSSRIVGLPYFLHIGSTPSLSKVHMAVFRASNSSSLLAWLGMCRKGYRCPSSLALHILRQAVWSIQLRSMSVVDFPDFPTIVHHKFYISSPKGLERNSPPINWLSHSPCRRSNSENLIDVISSTLVVLSFRTSFIPWPSTCSGWWARATPLKNMVRQLGWWDSQLNGKIKFMATKPPTSSPLPFGNLLHSHWTWPI